MKILFIYTLYDVETGEKPLKDPLLIQFGISYISALLKKNGHETQLIVLSRLSGKKNALIVNSRINDFKPDCICFSAVSSEFDFVVSIARYIRSEYPRIFLLIGGAHVSLNPESAIDIFDAVCIGEGEYPTAEVVERLEKGSNPSGVKNVWFKKDTGIEKNPIRPFIQELDSLPFPDRKMWDEWLDDKTDASSVLLGRGCPFECTYCCNHALKKLAQGTYTRYRNPHAVIEEIKTIISAHPNKREIYFEVETIGINNEWLYLLCDELKIFNETLPHPLTFGANIRIMPHVDYENVFTQLKQSHFRFINIGVESGNERIRRDILNRHYTNKDVCDVVTIAKRVGLLVSTLNLVGIPGETKANFQDTVRLNKILQPDWTGVSIVYPYPGTRLHEICRKEKLFGTTKNGVERWQSVLDMPHFTKKEIEREYIWFKYNIYKGYKPWIIRIKKVMYISIRRYRLLLLLYKQARKLLKKSFRDT